MHSAATIAMWQKNVHLLHLSGVAILHWSLPIATSAATAAEVMLY